MWQIILGGLIGGCIPTAVTILFSIKQNRQEAQLKLFERIFEKKLEIYSSLVNKMRELYMNSDWKSDKEEKEFLDLKLLFIDYFISITFLIPNQLSHKIFDMILMKKYDSNKYSDNFNEIIFEAEEIMRNDLELKKLDSYVKENLKLLRKEKKQK